MGREERVERRCGLSEWVLGTTMVLSGVSSTLSSVVEHCSGVDWLLHMSMLKLPWLDFSGKKFCRGDKIARCTSANSSPERKGQHRITSMISVYILFW